jgi:hypothetical protein
MTECDAMSDYQFHVRDEDFPDALAPSRSFAGEAGGGAQEDDDAEESNEGLDGDVAKETQQRRAFSVVAEEYEVMERSPAPVPIEPTYFGDSSGVPPPPRQSRQAAVNGVSGPELGVLVDHSAVEHAFQSTVAYSMVVEADRMSDYQAQVTDDDFPAEEEQDKVGVLVDHSVVEPAFQSTVAYSMVVEADRMSDYQAQVTDDDLPAEEEQDKVGVLLDQFAVEPAFQSTVAYSMVVEADRMSDYQAQVTDDDFPAAEEQDESVAFAIEEEEDIALPLLPEGWIECVDPTTSKVYYYNSTTEISRWERPSTHQEGGEEIKDTHEGDRQPVEIMHVNEQATTDVAVLNEALPAAGVGYELEIAAANAVLPADEVAKVNKVPFAIKEENL